MKTINKNRYREIEGLLSTVEFEVESDRAAFNYEDNEIYLDVCQWFDGQGKFFEDLQYKGVTSELTEQEKNLIFKRLCQVHRNFINEQYAQRLEDAQHIAEMEDTHDFINAHFHTIY